MTTKTKSKPAAPAIAEMDDAEAIIKAAGFNPEKMIGELGDFLLADLKAAREAPKPWAKMSANDQQLMIDRARRQAYTVVAGIIKAVAAKGLPHMASKLEGGSFKDGFFNIKCVAAMSAENSKLLASGDYSDVMLVFASPSRFDAPMEARPEPDQKALDF